GRPLEQAHLAEAAAEEAGQRQGDGVADRERGDHPGRLVGTGAEVAGDGRQRDVGDRGVQHLHERGERQAQGGQGHAGRTEWLGRGGRAWRGAGSGGGGGGGGHGGGRPSAVRARQVLLDDPGDQRVGLVQLPAVDGGGEARLAFAARLRQHLAAVIAH